MSDKNKNKKSLQSDFLRYRKGEMSGAERNSFERELQKDPFAEEAAEGLASITVEQASEDIEHLRKRLRRRRVPGKRFVFYRIAASIAVLMVISALFIFIERNKSVKQFSESGIKTEPFEIVMQEPIIHSAAENLKTKEKGRINQKKEARSAPRKESTEISGIALVPDDRLIAGKGKNDSIPEVSTKAVNVYLAEEKPAAPAIMKKGISSSVIEVKGKVVSSEDNMPVPGANIFLKGSRTSVIADASGNFSITLPDSANNTLVANFIGMESKEFKAKTDSQLQVKLDPSVSALSEVVVVGYGTRKDKSEDKDLMPGYIAPQPLNGQPSFDRYIRENIHRPDTATAGQRVVVVLNFLVHTDGRIDSMRIVRSPGKLFSDEAIRLVKYGPEWKPAIENGKIIEDEVRIRIVFR